MISARDLIAAIDALTQDVLQRWIELGWVVPAGEPQDFRFDAIDVARVRLISELHFDLEIEEDTMTMVLSLVDQLYTARRAFSAVMLAVANQPEDVRRNIARFVQAQPGRAAEVPEWFLRLNDRWAHSLVQMLTHPTVQLASPRRATLGLDETGSTSPSRAVEPQILLTTRRLTTVAAAAVPSRVINRSREAPRGYGRVLGLSVSKCDGIGRFRN